MKLRLLQFEILNGNTHMTIEQRTAKTTLGIIRENQMKFNIGKDLKNKVTSLDKQKELFTPNQLSLIDGLYEKYMQAGGFGSVKVKHDFVKK